jgi:hypothetical protein
MCVIAFFEAGSDFWESYAILGAPLLASLIKSVLPKRTSVKYGVERLVLACFRICIALEVTLPFGGWLPGKGTGMRDQNMIVSQIRDNMPHCTGGIKQWNINDT